MKNRIQDWITLILGIWLILSPWIFGFTGMEYAWNSYVLGALIAIFSVFALNDRKTWEEWINMVIGVWLFISPWIFVMVNPDVMWNHWIVGFLTFAVSLSSVVRAAKTQPA